MKARAVLTAATLGLATAAAPAQVSPPPAFTAGSCGSYIEGSQACGQPQNPSFRWEVNGDLATLSSWAMIEQDLPRAADYYVNTYYFVQLSSSTGAFPAGPVPVLASITGWAAVGGTAGSGGSFNNNYASSTVRVFDRSFAACAGFGCNNTPASFSGTFPINVVPGSSSSLIDPNIWRFELRARATTNSNFASSYARAYADPVVIIDPAYAAAHPEVSLIFSSNLPVPEAPTLPMLAAGCAMLEALARRRLAPR